ncbi:DUF2442 domain-containing protein [candidate division WOR-3 bacterium]|nr:DUF2442 domain-containing protein [candidate division WOR-3 bacterium]
MHFVKKARHAGAFRLLLTFEDGDERLVNLESHLDGPIFEPLKDPGYFRGFRVNEDLDTVVWDNGADFAPDFLHEIGQPVTEATRAAETR